MIYEKGLEIPWNFPEKNDRIYRDNEELFFLEPQSKFQIAVVEYFFSILI